MRKLTFEGFLKQYVAELAGVQTASVHKLADRMAENVQNQENTTIPLLEKQLREVNKKLDNLMKAIEDGLYTRTTKERLETLTEIFVNAIFLYDDRMLITFNYKDGTQTVRFEDTLTADCGEKSLRLRSNESPSGAFEQQNGLAQVRWRGLAPTSSDLSSSAGPNKDDPNLFPVGDGFGLFVFY